MERHLARCPETGPTNISDKAGKDTPIYSAPVVEDRL